MEETETIGDRIKKAREEKGLSIQDLADRAGCSDEYLGWVEGNQIEPPVALLLQLAKALKLDSGAFLLIHGAPTQRLEEAAKRTKHYSYETLTEPEEDKHLMAFSVTIQPKTAHEGVSYRHEGEEFVYVLSGELDITVGEDKRRLTARESLRFNANVDHLLSNPGEGLTELLVVLYVP